MCKLGIQRGEEKLPSIAMLKTLDAVKMLGDCLCISIPRRKTISNRICTKQALVTIAATQAWQSSSEITSRCSHTLSSRLGTTFKAAVLKLMLHIEDTDAVS